MLRGAISLEEEQDIVKELEQLVKQMRSLCFVNSLISYELSIVKERLEQEQKPQTQPPIDNATPLPLQEDLPTVPKEEPISSGDDVELESEMRPTKSLNKISTPRGRHLNILLR